MENSYWSSSHALNESDIEKATRNARCWGWEKRLEIADVMHDEWDIPT
jgi:hypothetical protein